MGGFGELLGSLVDLVGGVTEFVGDRAGERVTDAAARSAGGDGDDDVATGAVNRYLTGAPRTLGINDR